MVKVLVGVTGVGVGVIVGVGVTVGVGVKVGVAIFIEVLTVHMPSNVRLTE
jgi:hypothetical protein